MSVVEIECMRECAVDESGRRRWETIGATDDCRLWSPCRLTGNRQRDCPGFLISGREAVADDIEHSLFGVLGQIPVQPRRTGSGCEFAEGGD
jgi:hypothetical protein